MIDYTMLTLPCWSCESTFDVFTDLSNHHLERHERRLKRYAVADLVTRTAAIALAQDVPPLPSMPPYPAPTACCTCGCLYEVHRGITAEVPLQPCLNCSCRAFVLRLACGITPPGAPEACPICHHTYPQLLFCARCGPSCPACAPAHELVREAQRKALDPGIPPEAPSAVATAPPSSLFAFRALCEANGLTPCDDLSACQWLEALGIPPHTPAAAWATALDEAVERWKHRTSVPEDCPLCHHTFPVSCAHCGPACLACVAVEAVRGMWGAQPSQLEVPAEGCPVSRWMWQANSAGVHDYAHAETPGCGAAGCVVIRDTLSTTDRQEQEARL